MTKPTLESLSKSWQSLRDRVERIDKDMRALRDLLNVKDNWHASIRSMIGKLVAVSDRSGAKTVGVLLWSDRYNLCIRMTQSITSTTWDRIYTKGGINWIELAE